MNVSQKMFGLNYKIQTSLKILLYFLFKNNNEHGSIKTNFNVFKKKKNTGDYILIRFMII